jgi:hypothetical protein
MVVAIQIVDKIRVLSQLAQRQHNPVIGHIIQPGTVILEIVSR